MALFKTYDDQGKPFITSSIKILAAYTGASVQEARRAFYRSVSTINGHKVITYSAITD